MSTKLPTYFISHGGGPWPWLPDMRKVMVNLEKSLVEMVQSWPEKPEAILMISGHWEAETATIMAADAPPMNYDYYGFPDFTYQLQYPAPGAPEFAQQTVDLLKKAGIDALLDYQQGYDHGTFAPLYIMYPEAEVPVYQVSLLKSYDPEEHLQLGRALQSLREQGVMIIGSGLSFHNLPMFANPSAARPSAEFDAWLWQTLRLPPEQRSAQLREWEKAPYARVCHPKEDHLLPLFVALGAAENEKVSRVYHENTLMNGITASSFRFG